MSTEYIEQRDGCYYLAGTRISLDSIVYAFHRGESPETICQNFELLNLEQVYGAIAHYLAHKTAVDAYLKQQDQKWQEDKQRSAPLPGDLRQKLLRVREDLQTTRRS